MKVVINNCVGGFDLSNDAIRRFAELEGIKLYEEEAETTSTIHFYTVEPAVYYAMRECIRNFKGTPEGKLKLIESMDGYYFYSCDIPRNHPSLVQVVEELGARADGFCSSLKIVEIPNDIEWAIVTSEDGREYIAEKHRTWS